MLTLDETPTLVLKGRPDDSLLDVVTGDDRLVAHARPDRMVSRRGRASMMISDPDLVPMCTVSLSGFREFEVVGGDGTPYGSARFPWRWTGRGHDVDYHLYDPARRAVGSVRSGPESQEHTLGSVTVPGAGNVGSIVRNGDPVSVELRFHQPVTEQFATICLAVEAMRLSTTP